VNGSEAAGISISSLANSVEITVPFTNSVTSGKAVSVTVNDVTNPAAGTYDNA
jgi:hypothetical protein